MKSSRLVLGFLGAVALSPLYASNDCLPELKPGSSHQMYVQIYGEEYFDVLEFFDMTRGSVKQVQFRDRVYSADEFVNQHLRARNTERCEDPLEYDAKAAGEEKHARDKHFKNKKKSYSLHGWIEGRGSRRFAKQRKLVDDWEHRSEEKILEQQFKDVQQISEDEESWEEPGCSDSPASDEISEENLEDLVVEIESEGRKTVRVQFRVYSKESRKSIEHSPYKPERVRPTPRCRDRNPQDVFNFIQEQVNRANLVQAVQIQVESTARMQAFVQRAFQRTDQRFDIFQR